jgi:hypothetical protein
MSALILETISYMVENSFFNRENIGDVSYMIVQYALARFAAGENEIYIEMIREYEGQDTPYITWYHMRGESGTYIYSQYISAANEINDCWDAVKNVSEGLKTMLDGSGIVITPSRDHGWSFFCLSRGELMADF